MEIEHLKIKLENGIITYGGNQSRFEKVRKTACGMIAACDMILRLHDGNHAPVAFEKYNEFVNEMSKKYFYRHSKNPLGVPVRKILKMLNSDQNNYKFIFKSRIFFNSERLSETIEKSLHNNVPIIARIGANRKKLPYKITYPAVGNKEYENTMTWHYITITGLENGIITFCSWGGKGKMKLSDLHRFFGFTGGIITTKHE